MSPKARPKPTGRPAATLEEDNFDHPVSMTRADCEEAAAGILAIHAYFPNTYVMQSDLGMTFEAPSLVPPRSPHALPQRRWMECRRASTRLDWDKRPWPSS